MHVVTFVRIRFISRDEKFVYSKIIMFYIPNIYLSYLLDIFPICDIYVEYIRHTNFLVAKYISEILN